MFQRSRTLVALAGALLTTVMAVESNAGERFHRHHGITRINIRTDVRVIDRRVTINANRHRVHRNVNTYSGDVAVYFRRGVGNWSYGVANAPANLVASAQSAKIIDLGSGKNDCSMEKGVCVIRP